MRRVRPHAAASWWLALSGCAWAGATGCTPGPGDIPIATEVRANAVVVTCSTDCRGWAAEASEVAETAARVATGLFSVAPHDLGRLHLARDIEEYEAIESRTTGGRFRTNLAFSEPEARQSVVAVQPPASDLVLDETGLPMQTLRLVAHEVSHLTSYAAMPPPRRVPSWLEEGVAIHVESETRALTGQLPPDIGEDPLLSTYHLRTAEARDAGRLPSVSDLLADRDGDLAGGEVYAARAVLFMGMVAIDPEGVRRGLDAARRTHLEGGDRASVGEAFVRAFGGADRIGDAFAAQLARVEPRWDERSRSLETAGSTWEQHPFAAGSAHSVRVEPSGPTWTLTTGVVLGGDAALAAVTLRTDAGLWGFVRVSRDSVQIVRDAPREVVAAVARPESEQVRSGAEAGDGGADPPRVDLAIDVDGDVLRVRSSIGDLDPVALSAPLSGPWGLLAQGSGWVGWEDVVFRR